MATKTRVYGVGLRIINSIKADPAHDELNVQRFSRLAGMLGSEQLAWQALDEHDKADIVSDARERLAEANRKRREQAAKGGDA